MRCLPKIFINYRRDDSSAHAHRIYDHLVGVLGTKQVFFDIDNIPPGVDFVEFLERTVESCDILLAIIGRSWLTQVNPMGCPRIHDPEDFVAIEIEASLRRSLRVIPVLVDGARMPQKSELPEALWAFARRQAYQLPLRGFAPEMENLLSLITKEEVRTFASAIAAKSTVLDRLPRNRTPSHVLAEVREQIVSALSVEYEPIASVKKSRALYATTNNSMRVAMAISKEYAAGNFWFAYHPHWDEFLEAAHTSLFVLGCVGRKQAFAIPFPWLQKRFLQLNVTEAEGRRYFHIALQPDSKGALNLCLKGGDREELQDFAIPLGTRSLAAS